MTGEAGVRPVTAPSAEDQSDSSFPPPLYQTFQALHAQVQAQAQQQLYLSGQACLWPPPVGHLNPLTYSGQTQPIRYPYLPQPGDFQRHSDPGFIPTTLIQHSSTHDSGEAHISRHSSISSNQSPVSNPSPSHSPAVASAIGSTAIKTSRESGAFRKSSFRSLFRLRNSTTAKEKEAEKQREKELTSSNSSSQASPQSTPGTDFSPKRKTSFTGLTFDLARSASTSSNQPSLFSRKVTKKASQDLAPKARKRRLSRKAVTCQSLTHETNVEPPRKPSLEAFLTSDSPQGLPDIPSHSHGRRTKVTSPPQLFHQQEQPSLTTELPPSEHADWFDEKTSLQAEPLPPEIPQTLSLAPSLTTEFKEDFLYDTILRTAGSGVLTSKSGTSDESNNMMTVSRLASDDGMRNAMATPDTRFNTPKQSSWDDSTPSTASQELGQDRTRATRMSRAGPPPEDVASMLREFAFGDDEDAVSEASSDIMPDDHLEIDTEPIILSSSAISLPQLPPIATSATMPNLIPPDPSSPARTQSLEADPTAELGGRTGTISRRPKSTSSSINISASPPAMRSLAAESTQRPLAEAVRSHKSGVDLHIVTENPSHLFWVSPESATVADEASPIPRPGIGFLGSDLGKGSGPMRSTKRRKSFRESAKVITMTDGLDDEPMMPSSPISPMSPGTLNRLMVQSIADAPEMPPLPVTVDMLDDDSAKYERIQREELKRRHTMAGRVANDLEEIDMPPPVSAHAYATMDRRKSGLGTQHSNTTAKSLDSGSLGSSAVNVHVLNKIKEAADKDFYTLGRRSSSLPRDVEDAQGASTTGRRPRSSHSRPQLPAKSATLDRPPPIPQPKSIDRAKTQKPTVDTFKSKQELPSTTSPPSATSVTPLGHQILRRKTAMRSPSSHVLAQPASSHKVEPVPSLPRSKSDESSISAKSSIRNSVVVKDPQEARKTVVEDPMMAKLVQMHSRAGKKHSVTSKEKVTEEEPPSPKASPVADRRTMFMDKNVNAIPLLAELAANENKVRRTASVPGVAPDPETGPMHSGSKRRPEKRVEPEEKDGKRKEGPRRTQSRGSIHSKDVSIPSKSESRATTPDSSSPPSRRRHTPSMTAAAAADLVPPPRKSSRAPRARAKHSSRDKSKVSPGSNAPSIRPVTARKDRHTVSPAPVAEAEEKNDFSHAIDPPTEPVATSESSVAENIVAAEAPSTKQVVGSPDEPSIDATSATEGPSLRRSSEFPDVETTQEPLQSDINEPIDITGSISPPLVSSPPTTDESIKSATPVKETSPYLPQLPKIEKVVDDVVPNPKSATAPVAPITPSTPPTPPLTTKKSGWSLFGRKSESTGTSDSKKSKKREVSLTALDPKGARDAPNSTHEISPSSPPNSMTKSISGDLDHDAENAPNEKASKKKGGFTFSLFGRKKSNSVHHKGHKSDGQEGKSENATGDLLGGMNSRGPAARYSNYRRYPLHVERGICRLAHLKLANPTTPLNQQVLISNMLVWYMSLRQAEEELANDPTIGPNVPGNFDGTLDQMSYSSSNAAKKNKEEDHNRRRSMVVWKGGRFRTNAPQGGGSKKRKRKKKHGRDDATPPTNGMLPEFDFWPTNGFSDPVQVHMGRNMDTGSMGIPSDFLMKGDDGWFGSDHGIPPSVDDDEDDDIPLGVVFAKRSTAG